MKNEHEYILNYEKLTTIYGHWPSLHDSEVISVFLERDEGKPFTGVVMTIKLHVFRLEAAPDDPSRDDTLVTLLFRGVEALRLLNFNHQNAINGLDISRQYSDRLKKHIFSILFIPGFGMDCSFECSYVEVASAEPFVPRKGWP